ncbi:MAG: primosomal protein N' [Spirochaetes bacterium GWF1_41_5]|nr:MAG: primosomal protein N' [Spirochaetes bacterium GWF1_41_5]
MKLLKPDNLPVSGEIYVQMVFNLPLDTDFTYRYTGSINPLFCRALADFHGKKTVGFIISISKTPETDIPPEKIKNIEKILDDIPLIGEVEVNLARKITRQYFCSLGEAVALVCPFLRIIGGSRKQTHITQNTKSSYSLTDTQQQAVTGILERYSKGLADTFLVFGITGSGKSFVYLDIIRYMLSQNRQVIYLLPEISLTPQAVSAIGRYFDTTVALIHSKISAAQKMAIWKAVKKKEIMLIVGARSAVFAPASDLGAIIIDEEHDAGYKNDFAPRYHARQIAQLRLKSSRALLLLGSATPSIETFYFAQAGKIGYFEIPCRYNMIKPAAAYVAPKTPGEKKIICSHIYKSLAETVEKGEQSIVFLNRRGYSSSYGCSDCGYYCICPDCSLSMSYHKKKNLLICHYCGKNIIPFDLCPDCGSSRLKYGGRGTERIEEEMSKELPGAVIDRFDSDSAASPVKLRQILDDFAAGKINILAGTQMIIKGHHFPNVSLICIIDPEQYLAFPDFRSSERVFSQIVQAAGRTGRGNVPGRILIQSSLEGSYALEYAARQDYPSFYQREIIERRNFNYPPFSRLLRIVIRGADEKKVEQAACLLPDLFSNFSSLTIKGPAPCVLSKISRNYRWNLILGSQKYSELSKAADYFKKNIQRSRDIYYEIDPDPADLL